MRVREIMSSPAIAARPDATLADVADLMVRERIGCVVVVDPGDPARVVGIVTDSDLEIRDERIPFSFPLQHAPRLLDRWLQSAEQLEPALSAAANRPVAEVMSRPAQTVDVDAHVWDAARFMLEHDVKRLPVTEHGDLVGVVARHDLLKALVTARRRGRAARPRSEAGSPVRPTRSQD